MLESTKIGEDDSLYICYLLVINRDLPGQLDYA